MTVLSGAWHPALHYGIKESGSHAPHTRKSREFLFHSSCSGKKTKWTLLYASVWNRIKYTWMGLKDLGITVNNKLSGTKCQDH